MLLRRTMIPEGEPGGCGIRRSWHVCRVPSDINCIPERNHTVDSRREFLKSSLSGLAISAGAYAAGSDVIKVGVIGCGKPWARCRAQRDERGPGRAAGGHGRPADGARQAEARLPEGAQGAAHRRG